MKTGKRSGAKSSGREGSSHPRTCRCATTIPGGQPRDVLREGAGGEHQPLRLDLARSVRTRTPFSPAPTRARARRVADLGAARARAGDVGDDAPLGEHEAAVALVDDRRSAGSRKAGKPPRDLGAVELLEREPVLDARANRALEDPRPALDRARDEQQLLAGLRLELAPELVRPPHERHVARSARSTPA